MHLNYLPPAFGTWRRRRSNSARRGQCLTSAGRRTHSSPQVVVVVCHHDSPGEGPPAVSVPLALKMPSKARALIDRRRRVHPAPLFAIRQARQPPTMTRVIRPPGRFPNPSSHPSRARQGCRGHKIGGAWLLRPACSTIDKRRCAPCGSPVGQVVLCSSADPVMICKQVSNLA